MKIVIISDLHANCEALSALPETYDELWVLGDIVNYGPQPKETVEFVRNNASVTVRGNHDHAVGYDTDSRCTPAYAGMAEETRQFSLSALSNSDKEFLRNLPLSVVTQRNETRFYLCHAMPSDPLYGYCPRDSEQWEQEALRVQADFILVGHTHTPFIRQAGGKTIVNPGSLGQPKTGGTEACYAVWQNHSFELKSFPYPIEATITKIRSMPVSKEVQDSLIAVLRSGGELPQSSLKGKTNVSNQKH
jgi:putative phosphoesterase